MNPEDIDVKPPTLDPSASQTETAAPPVASPATPPAPPEAPKSDFKAEVVKDILEGFPDAPAEKPSSPGPVAEPPPAPAAKPAPNPFDDPDDPSADEIDPKLTKIRGGFEKLREKLRSAREEGQFGRLLVQSAKKAGIPPEAMAWWINLGARANTGDPAAVAELHAFTQRLGSPVPPTAPAAPAAPAVPAPSAVDAEAERIYREQYADEVKALELTEDGARRLARRQAERSAPAAAPAPALSHPVPPQPAPRQQPQMDPLEGAAIAELNSMELQYSKTVPDFAAVKAEALKRIEEQARASGPVPPIRWPTQFASVVRQVQAERAQAATKVAPPAASLRPTTTVLDPAKTSLLDHKRAIARAIAAGDEDMLPTTR